MRRLLRLLQPRRPDMRAALVGGVLLALAGGPARAQEAATEAIAAPPVAVPAADPVAAAKPPVAKPATPAPVRGITPNAERVVTIGAINKRTGETRNFVGRPGQQFDFAGLRVAVRTCETTPPWEQRLTGAFLIIDERLAKGGARRVFNGWMFAESPSLHPLEHPRYDIWVKSCTMRFPDTGPATVVAGRGDSAPAKASKAKKSADTSSAAPN